MVGDPDFEDFLSLLRALEPFLDRIVIVGGWAHHLYRFRTEAEIPQHPPLYTIDTDLAISPGDAVPRDAIAERLREHGFVEEYRGEDHPPITRYHPKSRQSTFYAEFLTPVVRRRKEKSKDTTNIGGIVAQALSNLDILLIEPWAVVVPEAEMRVQVPNPVSYIAQKLIIFDRRTAGDRAKDILYVHDTLELFGSVLGEFRQMWQQSVSAAIGRRIEEIHAIALQQFASMNATIIAAAGVADVRNLDPEVLRSRCEIGLETIFAP